MTFRDFPLKPELQQILADEGFETPTPVQEQAIPIALGGRDIVGIAQTGTGKTLAFLTPILDGLKPSGHPQAMVICPTRELALQVAGVAEKLGSKLGLKTVCVYGGTGLGDQRRNLDDAPDIVVGTPGRLIDFLSSAWLRPRFLRWLVLDEADRMLDMGFIDDVRTICSRVPLSRQTLLFSATMPPAIAELTQRFMYDPETVRISRQRILAEGIDHRLVEVSSDSKVNVLKKVMAKHRGVRSIVFTATREATAEMASTLRRAGHEVVSLSSLLSQKNRERALDGFRSGEYPVMVATDVAARGLDIVDVELVINFDMPQQAEDYVHRVGRTGRAERTGFALSFATPADRDRVADVERLLGNAIVRDDLDGAATPWPEGGGRERGGRSGRGGSRGKGRRGGGKNDKRGRRGSSGGGRGGGRNRSGKSGGGSAKRKSGKKGDGSKAHAGTDRET